MARGGGIVWKSISLFLRLIELLCAVTILGIFSYFLATLHNHGLHIATYIRAVEGISGAAVLYTLVALLLVCCLGGITLLSIIAMLLDLAFVGAFVYVAYTTRGGASSCKGNVNTPFGSGNTNTNNRVTGADSGFTTLPSLRTACKLETATFAVAIAAIVFFFLSMLVELMLIRHHKKEKAFGPSPNNGYTAGSPRRKFWQRKPKHDAVVAEKPDALPAHQTPADFRTSYATDATAVGQEPVYNKYGNGNNSNMTGGAGTRGINNAGTGVAAGGLHHHDEAVPHHNSEVVPQSTGTTQHGYQTTTTTHVPSGGYTPFRHENV